MDGMYAENAGAFFCRNDSLIKVSQLPATSLCYRFGIYEILYFHLNLYKLK